MSSDLNERIPVTIFSYHSSRQSITFLLRRLLNENPSTNFAILIDSETAVSSTRNCLDDELRNFDNLIYMKHLSDPIMDGNCLSTCAVKEQENYMRTDLIDALKCIRLSTQLTPDVSVDYVLVYSDKDPLAFIRTFFYEHVFLLNYYLDGVVAMLEATQMVEDLSRRPSLSTQQNLFSTKILSADQIILSGIEEFSDQENVALNCHLCEIHRSDNPVLFFNRHTTNLSLRVLHLRSFALDRIGKELPTIFLAEKKHTSEGCNESSHTLHLVLDGELHVDQLSKWMEEILIVQPELIRYRGVFAIKGRQDKYVFQGVDKFWSGGYSKTNRWNHEKPRNFLEVTGFSLNRELISQSFQKCLIKNVRFAIGTPVQAFVGRWENGIIIAHWDEGNAYRIRLKKDYTEVWALHDTDELVRKKPKRMYGNNHKNRKHSSSRDKRDRFGNVQSVPCASVPRYGLRRN